jgi:starch synthase (maltosyl-transferring)
MILYNLFPLLAGDVRQWTPHLQRAADLGFDAVFINPIQYPGYSGSLYSIKDYFRLNPLIAEGATQRAAEASFRAMAREAEKLGLKLIVDLVVSHCAFDSDLIKEHPTWFVREGGKVAHPWCMEGQKKVVWRDLAQFDHKHTRDKEGLQAYLVKVVDYLVELGITGFRCDAAYQVPAPFWRHLIQETRRKHPGTLFLAETLGCSPVETMHTARAGFDFIFNSAKWWDLRSPWLIEQYSLTREHSRSISFPESHDTERLAAETDGNVNAVKQRYFFSAFFSSGVMMPMGFEFGFRKRLHVVKTRPEDWESPSMDLTAFVREVNRAKARNPIFMEEAPIEILPCNNPNVLFLWKGSLHAGQEALIILNKDLHHEQHFHTDDLYQHIQSSGPLRDVSPEHPLDYLPTPYEYGLRPGQGIVLVTDPVSKP